MIKKLYVFGNIGKMNMPPKSGGQSSARRVIDGLRQLGLMIVPIVRHRAEWEGKLAHIIEVGYFAVWDLLKIIGFLLFGNRKKTAFLILTYGGPLVPYEFLIACCVKMLGYKSITYMKGGQFMDYYNNGSKLHRWLCRKTFDIQSQAWFEGINSLEIVQKISNTQVVYFPNYVFEKDIPAQLVERPKDRINLCYFGRIAPNKNTHIVVETFNLLCEKHNNVYLTIIGGIGQSKAYADMVDDMIASSPYKNHITRMGLSPFSVIKDILQSQHFFIFPSKERCEGHSNSLNEAMANGVIPIVSDYHFNRSVVGDERLVVDGFDSTNYMERVEGIITSGEVDRLSIQVWQTVKKCYSYNVVNTRIAKMIERL